jgi:TPR repeat protein
MVSVVLLVAPLPAQQALPSSTETRRTALNRVETLSQKDLKEVFSKAQSGDQEAEYFLALTYEEGHLVPRNFPSARSWMQKSAEQGYVPAEEGMGELILGELKGSDPAPDYANADRWLRLAATQGNADAQFWLGNGYEQNWFGGSDYGEAIRWLREAADQGLPDAQFCLGRMYEDGEGIPENFEIAARWYRKAADHFPFIPGMRVGGVFEAEGRLVDLYRNGRLKRDYGQAYLWSAILDSSLAPATDQDVQWAAQHMTKTQVAEAQHRAEDWIKRHTPKATNVTQGRNSEN